MSPRPPLGGDYNDKPPAPSFGVSLFDRCLSVPCPVCRAPAGIACMPGELDGLPRNHLGRVPRDASAVRLLPVPRLEPES